ncbi:hypothetical protein A2X44_01670 [candidate division CPR3 bacterium GWF2_35_18]|uniref:Uncharacterized protein n=1 Tax=candidate division CPR3 bacterium GW2011_GWF2_35_18 TaxID=1618350 RepID=A0A0G0BKD7_UNCC3|nr:MAG: hypothetical protein UR67_C0002G0018 [candidate division CPR3 bacterium GW2011_GWF2_35_18]OGB62709.1 MAG: hypothetical protein A2X44_01670 [candidate division CPR3 bacterium GWF2_35_18]OGB65735.1 MAG: hypothetical protein A2250_01930 [candidate division CPR3 bacterium RIFOXYA2_FULL_35_13]OGB78791.1 MAG: hypothetical protein A2296_02530 [candidate division CPR3 bacterium RIFOXYB2_FULL_35_8]
MKQQVTVEIFKPNSPSSLICHGEMDTDLLLITPETSDIIHLRRAVQHKKKVRIYDAKTGTPLYEGALQAQGVSDFQLINPIRIIGISVLVKSKNDFLRDKVYIPLQPDTVIPAGASLSITGPFLISTIYQTLTEISITTTVVEVEVYKGIIIPIEPLEVPDPEDLQL